MSWRRLLSAAAILLLGGCSALQLGYRNADTFLRWQANAYFDFEGSFADEVDSRIAAFLAWHRSQALPAYIRILDDAAARTGRSLSRDDLFWGYDAVIAQADTALRVAASEAAPLLDRLTPAQIAHLERRFGEDNRKFARENLSGTAEERRTRRLKRNVERLEDWLGGLSEVQLERVRHYSKVAPLTDALRDRDRKRRQAEFVDILRAREARTRLAAWAVRWQRDRAPDYAAASREQLERMFEMLLDIEKTMSAAQREHAVRRLRAYAEDLAALTRVPGPKAEAR